MRQIAILHYTLPPLLDDISRLIYDHIYYLNQAGYLLRLITGSGDESYFEASFHHQIEFYPIPGIDPAGTVARAVTHSLDVGLTSTLFNQHRDLLASQLRPLLEDASLCIVHDAVTSPRNIVLTAALHLLYKEEVTRFVAWQHDPDQAEMASSQPSGYPWDLVRSAWPGVRYVAGSRSGAERLGRQVGLPVGEVMVIPQGINAPEFFKWEEVTRQVVQSYHLLEADPLLLAPSRMGPAANLELAVRATAILAEDFPRTTLLVSGSPAQNQDQDSWTGLLALPAALGIEEHVIFLFDTIGAGDLTRTPENVQADLARLADLLLLPAFEESSTAPLLWAALARLPVLAADIPFNLENSDGQVTFFEPHSSPNAVAALIKAVLKRDPARPALRRVLEKRTWPAILQKSLIPLIEETAQ